MKKHAPSVKQSVLEFTTDGHFKGFLRSTNQANSS